jgi:hypothetical protein
MKPNLYAGCILTLLFLTVASNSLPQIKEAGQDNMIANKELHKGETTVNQTVNRDVIPLRYFQKNIAPENFITTAGLSNEPFSSCESHKIQVSSTENVERFTPFKGIVIGYNYVCITKGAWQWESGRLKYFFNSRLTGSIKAKIKYFKFDNLEISLNFKL